MVACPLEGLVRHQSMSEEVIAPCQRYNVEDQLECIHGLLFTAAPPKLDLSSLNHKGVVTRVLPDGYAYVDESGPNQRRYIISFRRSVPNYRGETARELSLSRGTQVRFSRKGNEIQRIAVGPNYEEFLRNR